MSESLSKIKKLKSLIIFEVDAIGNVFDNEINYLSSDFSATNLKKYKSIEEIISSINPHAEVSIGVGFVAYCKNIRKGIIKCIEDKADVSFVFPLWDMVNTYSFIATFSYLDEKLIAIFQYLPNGQLSTNIDSLVASTFKDQLTGLFNRNTMESHLKENNRNGYLCLFDLNKFKMINDTFGHKVGDKVLTLLADYLIKISTDKEVYYRISGDEFIALFFSHDLSYVKSVINNIESFMEKMHEEGLKGYDGIRCSASFGLLELFYPTDEEPLDSKLEVQLVDLAMYQAKATSRRLHIISHEDALNIIKQGNLEQRLTELAASLKR